MTNREYITALLSNSAFVDDGGASYEAMVFYNINCPYFDGNKRAYCHNGKIDRETCYACKEEWLDLEVEE